MSPRRSALVKGVKPTTCYSAAEGELNIKSRNLKANGDVLENFHCEMAIFKHEGTTTIPMTFITKIKVTKNLAHTSVTDFETEFLIKSRVPNLTQSRKVGHLSAETIDRRTVGRSKPLYQTELLAWDLERPLCHVSPSEEDVVDETQTIFRHLFHANGTPRQEYQHRPIGGRANLHFIGIFEIENEFHGTSLAQLALGAYHEAIRLIPGYGFKQGTIVLSPAALYDNEKAQAETMDFVQVEHALIRSYRKSGYKVWTKSDDSRGGGGITIMGRTVGKLSPLEQDLEAEALFLPYVRPDRHAPAKDAQDIGSSEKQQIKKRPKSKIEKPASKPTGVIKHRKPKSASRTLLENIAKSPAKRTPPSRTALQLSLESAMENKSSVCELCGRRGGGQQHAFDCEIWFTPCFK